MGMICRREEKLEEPNKYRIEQHRKSTENFLAYNVKKKTQNPTYSFQKRTETQK